MGRAPCCAKVGLNRGRWTAQEDEILSKYIQTHGEGSWRELPKNAGLLRCGKSCRLRWINYLRSDLKRGNFSSDEDELIIILHGLLGNKWSLIAARMAGRTDNEIKNYWNTHLSRKLADRGIDPVTHKPLYYNYSLQRKRDTESEVSSSIKSSILIDEDTKRALKTKKSFKNDSVVLPKRNKSANIGHERGVSEKKKSSLEHISSKNSKQSSCESCSETDSSRLLLTSAPIPDKVQLLPGKTQSEDCNASVLAEGFSPVMNGQDEYPSSSLTANSSNLWEESFSSNMLPSDMDLFGSFNTEDLTMFGNQLPDPSNADDRSNAVELLSSDATDDLWSFFLSNLDEPSCPSSLSWILPPRSQIQ